MSSNKLLNKSKLSLNSRGVTRHLSHDETRDWVHENETRFLDFFFFKDPQRLNIYGKLVFHSTEKHKNQLILYEIKLIF